MLQKLKCLSLFFVPSARTKVEILNITTEVCSEDFSRNIYSDPDWTTVHNWEKAHGR